MRIARIGVVLNGASNDKDTLLAVMRTGAREGAAVRITLGPGCTRETCEKHLDFALWDVRQRLGLQAPEVTVESRLAELDVEIFDRTAVTSRGEE